jgi:lysophospholipase L1-like esterase
MTNRFHSLLSVPLLFCGAVLSADDMTIDCFKDISGWRGPGDAKFEKVAEDGFDAMRIEAPLGRIERRAYPFSLSDRAGFGRFSGISFRVKGDGGEHNITVSLFFANTYDLQYCTSIPIRGKEWQTITLAWGDFINRSSNPGKLGEPGGLPVSGVDSIAFGDSWKIAYCNSAIPRFHYEVADLRFVEKSAARLTLRKYPFLPIESVVAKMKAGEPVLIYCQGDSITAGTGVGDQRYGNKLEAALRKDFKNERIRVKTVAVGGAHTIDLRLWAERDFSGDEKPDLVTLHIGYNDRGAGRSKAWFKASVENWIDRVNSLTEGKTAFLLLPTIPGQVSRYTMLDDYAEAIREIAAERNLAAYDLAKDFKGLGAIPMIDYFCNGDKAHPNVKGHEFIAARLEDFFK